MVNALHDRVKKFRVANIFFIFIPIPVFILSHVILMTIYGTEDQYNLYFSRSVSYLAITGFIILGFLLLLTHKPTDLIFTAVFIGIARAITLNALWGGWLEMLRNKGSTWPGVQMVYDIAYWPLQFLFSAMIPILVIIGALLASDNTRQVALGKGINIRYLVGLMTMSIFTYITWSLLNEYGIFFIWGLENFTPQIAVWFPPESWFFGVPWIFWTAPIGIGGTFLGFHFSKS